MRKYITKASERIGVESTSRDGKRAQVVSYSTCENFIIRFCDGKEMKLKNWRYFIEGNFNYEKHFKAPRNREERIGEKKVMNNGLTAEVIEYRGSHDMDILFEDGGKRTGVSWRDFCIGNIAHPTIHGGNVSQNELVLRFYLESLGFVRIPQRSKRSDRVGLEGKELDLYNDKLKIAIEYDGEYSHTKNKDDEGKNKIVEKLGIKLYRFREPGCSGVSGRNYILEDSRFMSASLECCLKSFVRDVLKKDDKFINFEKDKRTIKEYVSRVVEAFDDVYESGDDADYYVLSAQGEYSRIDNGNFRILPLKFKEFCDNLLIHYEADRFIAKSYENQLPTVNKEMVLISEAFAAELRA